MDRAHTPNKLKQFFSDMIWSISGLVLMNGVLQLYVYPVLNEHLGSRAFGDVLYMLGILAIFTPSVGLAGNNIRLVERRKYDVKNGDVLLAMAPHITLFTVVFLGLIHSYAASIVDVMLAACLLPLTAMRYYGDVEYRMTLHYRGYFTYYAVISAGYILGTLLYPMTKNWMLIFLMGELAVCLFLLAKGHIYRPAVVSENRAKISQKVNTLTCSYLLYNVVLNLDRILLQNLMEGEAVTVYYVASLLGKTAALLAGPLNGVVIGHLSGSSKAVTRNQYLKVSLLLAGVGGVFWAVILFGTPIFVHLFYPSIFDEVRSISSLASLSQVVCFSSSLLLTIMLTFCSEKWQLAIQGIYALLFLVVGIVGISVGGLKGFVAASLFVNVLRFAVTVLIGMERLTPKVP